MNNLLQKVKSFFASLKQEVKSLLVRLEGAKRLPQGVTEFYDWSNSIIKAFKLPNNDSVHFMLATMILHAKEDAAYLSKRYFGLRAVKSAANQVAAGVMQDLKQKQQSEIEAEKAKQAAAIVVNQDTNNKSDAS